MRHLPRGASWHVHVVNVSPRIRPYRTGWRRVLTGAAWLLWLPALLWVLKAFHG
jgi:hypothetical protein